MSGTRTHHERAAGKLLDELLYSPTAAAALARTRRRLREGLIDPDYVGRVGQTHRGPNRWPPEQAAAFLRVHTGLTSGEFAQILLPLHETPVLDAERKANRDRLSSLNSSFRASLNMKQDHADSDGYVWWDESVIADQSIGTGEPVGADMRPATRPVEIAQGGLPLEVGYTLPSRTLQHLLQSGGVARWPYHQKSLWIVLNMRPGQEHVRRTRGVSEVSA